MTEHVDGNDPSTSDSAYDGRPASPEHELYWGEPGPSLVDVTDVIDTKSGQPIRWESAAWREAVAAVAADQPGPGETSREVMTAHGKVTVSWH
jgi:hypothetical protein